MTKPGKKSLLLTLACVLLIVSPGASAQSQVPLRNWAVPTSAGSRPSALDPLGDAGNPAIFIPFTPCRMVDTRAGFGFSGSYGPPALAGSTARNFPMTSGSGPCVGIPTGAAAISLNVTVVNTLGAGFIKIYPEGGAVPPVSTLNYNAGQVVANAAIVPMSTAGGITVVAGVSGTDLILDVNGYFIGGATDLNATRQLWVSGSVPGSGIIRGTNKSPTGDGGYFETSGSGSEVTGVTGLASAATGVNYGVHGRVESESDWATGVFGWARGTTGEIYGVRGLTGSLSYGAAGVLGSSDNAQYPNAFAFADGVLGRTRSGIGVFGQATSGRAVQGARVSETTGQGVGSSGVLGYMGSYGVYSFNDIGAIGTKSFIEPHPTDPGRQIVYVAMEGPEAGTYFRGRGRFVGLKALIAVPEDFRLVTEEEGLTVQITPMGRATTWVNRAGLDLIEAQSTADVEFSYLVQGVRRNYEGHEPIQKNTLFIPPGFDAKMESYPAHIQKRLVDVGIYHPDGSVNLETAERMGWARTWREEEAGRKAAAAARETADLSREREGAPRR